jgi:hypothetical protein
VYLNGSNFKTGGGGSTIYRGPALRKGALGPTMLHVFLSFLVVSLPVDCTNSPFQTKTKSLCNYQSFRFDVKIFSHSALVGGHEKKITGA